MAGFRTPPTVAINTVWIRAVEARVEDVARARRADPLVAQLSPYCVGIRRRNGRPLFRSRGVPGPDAVVVVLAEVDQVHVVVLIAAVVVREIVRELHGEDELRAGSGCSRCSRSSPVRSRIGGAGDAPEIGEDRLERIRARVDDGLGVAERGLEVCLLARRIRLVRARQIHLRTQRQRGAARRATDVRLRHRKHRDRGVEIGEDRLVHGGRRSRAPPSSTTPLFSCIESVTSPNVCTSVK